MFMAGLLVTMIAVFVIFMMIYAGIDETLKEKDDERVQYLADKRFNEMLKNADVHVVQRLVIKDEMRRSHEI